MNKALISFFVATFAVLAFVECQTPRKDAMKENMIAYLTRMTSLTEAELSAKELPELVDMAIASIQKRKDATRDEVKIAALNDRMSYFLGIKDSLNPPKSTSDAVHYTESEKKFDEQVKNAGSKLVVVDFFAHWCGPCKKISPHLESLAKQFESQIVVLKVDVDQDNDLAWGRYEVSRLPTFIFLKNGEVVERFSGADTNKIDEAIAKYK